jgi:queuine tRNA-ribosyltransferase
MLGPILLTHHNLTYYQRLLAGARQAIDEGRFGAYFQERTRAWDARRAIAGAG